MERTIRAVRLPLYGAFVLASVVATMLAFPIGLTTLGERHHRLHVCRPSHQICERSVLTLTRCIDLRFDRCHDRLL